MQQEDWDEFDKLFDKYEKARGEYYSAQMKLRGVFSELSRRYDKATLDHNRLYEEELAHENFFKARGKLHEFLKQKLKKD